MTKVGVIGGSGLYNIEGLEDTKWVKVDTPFGEPSDEYLTGKLGSSELVFLPRHGRGHRISPSKLNYVANIYGMKSLGVDRIVSVSAVGSLKEEIKPLDIMIPDQFVDRTNQARRMTFFEDGIVAHVSFADPICPCMAKVVSEAAKAEGATVHTGGTYLNMEGPAFSTKAESHLHRQWGMDIIGMTNMSEAKVAREAEICYVTMAMITDYDCWREAEEGSTVDIQMIVQNLQQNAEMAKRIIKRVLTVTPDERHCACAMALEYAIITDRDLIPAETKKKLELIIGKYVK